MAVKTSSNGKPVGDDFYGNCILSGAENPFQKECRGLKEDIPYCQSKGVKIFVRLSTDEVASSESGVDAEMAPSRIARYYYNMFGPYAVGSKATRPLDPSPTEHVAVDGIDFAVNPDLGMIPCFFSESLPRRVHVEVKSKGRQFFTNICMQTLPSTFRPLRLSAT